MIPLIISSSTNHSPNNTRPIPDSAWVFALGGLLALLIALATVGVQAARAAIANPINSLRTE